MHSFDNGSKAAAKTDNWNQLSVFFRKRGLPIIIKNPDALILNENNATIEFVKQVYTLLTERALMPPIKVYETDPATQSLLLKDKEMVKLPRDDGEALRKEEESKKEISVLNQSSSKSPQKSLAITKGP